MTFSAFFGRPHKPAQLDLARPVPDPQLDLAQPSSTSDELKSRARSTYVHLGPARSSENAFSHRTWFLPTQLAWINDAGPLRLWEKASSTRSLTAPCGIRIPHSALCTPHSGRPYSIPHSALCTPHPGRPY